MIEEAFFKHPDVIDVAAIGVPDAYAGEVPGAYVVMKEDARVDAEDFASVRSKNHPGARCRAEALLPGQRASQDAAGQDQQSRSAGRCNAA
ncbi:AMP-binding enzyme [Cupriavidus basilensis]